MEAARGYRFSGGVKVGPAATHLTGEFQAPDRVHETVTTTGGTSVELIMAGGRAFVHDRSTGRWSKVSRSQAVPAPSDPRKAFAVLEQATGVTGNGAVYSFSLPAQAAVQLAQFPSSGSVNSSGEATLLGATISHLTLRFVGSDRTVEVYLSYSDVGTAPPVTEPPA